jgi:hypothetical protein
MKFKTWFKNIELLEMSDILKMSTDDVPLETMTDAESEFDDDQVENECEKEVPYADEDGDNGVYNDPHDDPEFNHTHPDNYEDENPPPDPDDFENGKEDKDYKSDLITWNNEKFEHEKDYEKKVARWERVMDRKRAELDEKESHARWEAIQECKDKKREEWEESRKNTIGFQSSFKHEGEDFHVVIYNDKIEYAGHEVPGSYRIEFEGPNRYNTTGTAGTQATAIYSKMLLVIKKLMTTQEVNGITFEPHEPGMALVYQRFYDRFLKNEFTRISTKQAVRTTYIEKVNANLHPDSIKNAQAKITSAEKETQDYLGVVKNNRGEERRMKVFCNLILNKVVKAKDGSNIFVARYLYDQGQGKVIVDGISDQGGKYSPIRVPADSLTQTPTDIHTGSKLLNAITKNQKWMDKIQQKPFSTLAKQYGLNVNQNQAFA